MTPQSNDRLELDTREETEVEDSAVRDEPASNSIALCDQILAHPALFDSIIAAPMQVKKHKKNIPLYSDYLMSRVVAILVEEQTYLLHSSLICQKSKRFKKDLTNGFQEQQNLKIDLPEESPDLFSRFVDFLYMPGWKPTCESGSDLLYLLDLYAMGERFLAREFQGSVLRIFIDNITKYQLENSQLCQLLRAACDTITERQHPKDDAMREHIFWLAAKNLTNLQRSEDFRELLVDRAEIGRHLTMKAGNGTNDKPPDPFDDDGEYHAQKSLHKQKNKGSHNNWD